MQATSKLALVAAGLLGLSVQDARADVVKCDGSDTTFSAIKWIAFDTSERTAAIEMLGIQVKGSLTLSRPFSKGKLKYNFQLPSPYPFHEEGAVMEVILFPAEDGFYGLGGTVSVEVNGQRHVDLLVPFQKMACDFVPL